MLFSLENTLLGLILTFSHNFSALLCRLSSWGCTRVDIVTGKTNQKTCRQGCKPSSNEYNNVRSEAQDMWAIILQYNNSLRYFYKNI